MLHLFLQMANTAPEKPSEQAPCLGSSAVSVFTSSFGCETALGKAPAVGLPGEVKNSFAGSVAVVSLWMG